MREERLDRLDRILSEMNDLNYKIGRLSVFVKDCEHNKNINSDDDKKYAVLKEQLSCMENYRKCLEKRIKELYY